VGKIYRWKLVQGTFWLVTLAETLVILASINPSRPLSKAIYSTLIREPADPYNVLEVDLAFWLGLCMTVSGGWIRQRCYRELGFYFTYELSIRKDHKLITSGPYSIVRHPSYVGVLLSGIGGSMCHVNHGSWVVRLSGLIPDTWTVFLILWLFAVSFCVGLVAPRLGKEDAMLKREFGDKWDKWVKAVPFQLVPGIL